MFSSNTAGVNVDMGAHWLSTLSSTARVDVAAPQCLPAFDSSNNIYSVGTTRFGYTNGAGLITKRAYDGSVLWSKKITDSSTFFVQFRAVSRVGTDIYVLCNYIGQPSVLKMTEAGALTSSVSLSNTLSIAASAMAVDASGNMYIAGYKSASPTRGFLAKFDSAGTLSWQREFYRSGSTGDQADSVVLGADGYIYVGGTTYASTSPFNDAFIVKYSSSGTLTASAKYVRTGYASGTFLCADPAGGLFMLVSNENYVCRVAAVDANTITAKVITLSGQANWASIAVSPSRDALYLVGGSTAPAGLVARVDPGTFNDYNADSAVWARTLGLAYTYVRGVGVDGVGNLHLTGYTDTTPTSGTNSYLQGRVWPSGAVTGAYASGNLAYSSATITTAGAYISPSTGLFTDTAGDSTSVSISPTVSDSGLTNTLYTM